MTFDVDAYNAYTHGVRTPEARKAKADYMRRRRAEARRRAREFGQRTGGRYIAPIDNHGTRYGFEEAGCRCAACVAARNASERKYRRRR